MYNKVDNGYDGNAATFYSAANGGTSEYFQANFDAASIFKVKVLNHASSTMELKSGTGDLLYRGFRATTTDGTACLPWSSIATAPTIPPPPIMILPG